MKTPQKRTKNKETDYCGRSVFVSEGEAAVWADSLCGVHGSITGEWPVCNRIKN